MSFFAAAGLAISAGSAISGFMGSSKAEKAARDAAEYQSAIGKKQAKLQQESIAVSKEEARHKASMDLRDTTVAFMQERAAAIAGAGEAGVAGGSVVRTIADKFQQESDIRGRHLYQLNSFVAQADREIRGVQLGLAGQVNTYKGISDSSLALSSGLDFASSALSIGNDAGWF